MWGELDSEGLHPCPCRAVTGDSALIPVVQGSMRPRVGHLGGRSQRSSQCIQGIPIAEHPAWQERAQIGMSTDITSTGASASGELPHTRSPAQQGPAWPTRLLARPRVSPWPKFSPWHGAGSFLWARVKLPGSARVKGEDASRGAERQDCHIAPTQLNGGRQGQSHVGQKQWETSYVPGWTPVSQAVPLPHRPAPQKCSKGTGGS